MRPRDAERGAGLQAAGADTSPAAATAALRRDGKWKVVGSKKDLYYADTGKYGGYLYVEADDIWNAL